MFQVSRFKGLSALLLLAFALALGLSFQGARGIWEPDEGRYVPTAAAMYDSGDLMVPRLNGGPYLDKPPLTYWGMAGGMWLFGHTEFGARAFHGFCFAGTVLLTCLLGMSFWGRRDGLLAGLSYATMIGPLVAGNVCTMDTPLALWVTAAFCCFWKGLAAAGRRAGLWKVALCGAIALGVLTKGPAVLVFAGAMFVYLAIVGRLGEFFVTPWALPGFMFFCAIVLPWYWAIAKALPGALAFIWENEVTGRLLTAHYRRSSKWYDAFRVYVPMFFVGTLPWSLAWPALLKRAWREGSGRDALRAAGEAPAAPSFLKLLWEMIRSCWQSARACPELLCLLCWALFPLAVFSLASSKMYLYILPAFPALALLTARGLGRLMLKASTGLPPRLLLAVGLWALLMLGAKLGAANWRTDQDSRCMWQAISPHLPPGPCPIIAVDLKLNGLLFYCHNSVYTADRSPPLHWFFVEDPQFEDEIKAAAHSASPRAFVVGRAETWLPIRKMLRALGVEFEEYPLPYDRALLVCQPTRTSG
ncbi:MAG: phospholipid carrier-dependent glycosyltransferase [Planctomycetota bacterium]